MKKFIYSLIILSVIFCFTSCPFFSRPEPVTDPLFLYTVEAIISNESSSEKLFMTDAYILLKNEKAESYCHRSWKESATNAEVTSKRDVPVVCVFNNFISLILAVLGPLHAFVY